MTSPSTATAKVKKSIVNDTTELERTQCLSTSLYNLRNTSPFYSSMLQSMNIFYTDIIPTAGVCYSSDNKRYEMLLNPMFFIRSLDSKNRDAVLLHEILHLVNGHLTRIPFMAISNHNRKLMNIAGDLSINQYIKNLPNGCPECPPVEDMMHGAKCENQLCCGYALNIKDFYDEDDKGNKKAWPVLDTMENYFVRLKERYDDQGEGEEDGDGSGNGGTPREFDSHNWEASAEESEMLEGMGDLLKRAMIRSNTGYSDMPALARALLENIETRKAELNYKHLIALAIRKSVAGYDRKNSWTRKSRRFGNLAPGSKEGPQASLSFRIDTSGSISIVAMNEFLEVVDGFLKVGSKKCSIHLFSDNEYYSAPYKVGDRLKKEMIQSNVKMGGTCLESSLKNILQKPSDLNLILTDGYYSNIDVESWLPNNKSFPKTLFIIEKSGTKDHPFSKRDWQETILIPK